MPAHRKPISKISQFLLENNCGSDAESIKNAKRLYWNRQKALWLQNQRKQNKTVTVAFDSRQYSRITAYAKRHMLSRIQYVRNAALAYGDGAFIQLSPDCVGIIRDAFLLNFHALHQLREELILPDQATALVLSKVEELQNTIQNELNNPKRIEGAVIEQISLDPSFRQKITELLKHY